MLRTEYATTIFRQAAAIRKHPDATPKQLRAARIMAATDTASLRRAMHEPQPLMHDLHAPNLLTGPTKKAVRLVDETLGPIFQLGPVPLPPTVPVPSSSAKKKNTSVAESSNPVRPPNKKKEREQEQFNAERRADMVRYYSDWDEEPDPDMPFGLPPGAYHAYPLMIEERAQQYHARHERAREAANRVERKSVETVLRAYCDKYRRPLSSFPASEERRGCCNLRGCVVYDLARQGEQEARPHWGYTLPEFLTPSQEEQRMLDLHSGSTKRAAKWREPALPVGPCIACELRQYAAVVQQNTRTRKPEADPVNRFTVIVGAGEYGLEALIGEEQQGVPTGVRGHIPVFDSVHYHFDPQPGDTAILREVNVDFHMRLNQCNACLGARKSRPLAGVNGTISSCVTFCTTPS